MHTFANATRVSARTTASNRGNASGVQKNSIIDVKNTPDAMRSTSGKDFSEIPTHSEFNAMSSKSSLRPHEGSPEILQQEAEIYAQGKTPIRIGGGLIPWNAKPLSPRETGAHLSTIQNQFGEPGIKKSISGLNITRGKEFTRNAMEFSGLPKERMLEGDNIGRGAAGAIRTSSPTGALPNNIQETLTNRSGYDFSGISIHNNAHSHLAADYLNARAFTIGNDIYFGKNEYQPTTNDGMHLLSHESAHVIQQRGQNNHVNEHANAADSAGKEEEEATHFADLVSSPNSHAMPSLTPSTKAGLVHRAISFTHASDTITTNAVVADENAAGFRLASNPRPALQWNSDVTIHGVAGDPFGNFQVGFMQVEREFYVNVHWGSGVNETHRAVRPDAPLPRRDATAAGNLWYNDGGVAVAPVFAANGDVRSPSFDDTPGTARMPWANPTAGRVSDRGWFNYGDAFVTYLSARDTTAAAGAAGFRHLANMYWNLSASGRFDTTQAIGARVTLASNPVNHSAVLEGGSGEFPAMHGGIIANGHDTTTDT